tara:strand:+ start:560 stop:1864 length:1305 start_codon:yes stop_codon:yes gene_type:complete
MIFSSLIISPMNSLKAETLIDTISRAFSYAVAEDPTKTIDGGGSQINIYKIDSTGAATLVVENLYPDGGPGTFSADQYAIDAAEGKIYFREPPRGNDLPLRARVFDIKTETLEEDWVTISGLPDGAMPIFVTMPTATKDQINKQCASDDGSVCNENSNQITLGGTGTDELMKVDANGISTGGSSGKSLVKYVGDELHIGENSWITKEENGKQSVYAKDANGNAIPINYVNGTDLQINGKSVQGQIDTNASNISTNTSNISTNSSNISTNTSNIKNLGEGVASSTALTAALTALPQTSKESKLSCGFGTGAYSSKYAVGFGCASKVNERVDINAGGSYVFGGSKSYGAGTLDSGVIKAGLVFKLGKLNKTTQISMKDKKIMETKLESLEEKNKKILSKNQKLENKLSILMARLENIEKIALRENKSKDLAVYKLK